MELALLDELEQSLRQVLPSYTETDQSLFCASDVVNSSYSAEPVNAVFAATEYSSCYSFDNLLQPYPTNDAAVPSGSPISPFNNGQTSPIAAFNNGPMNTFSSAISYNPTGVPISPPYFHQTVYNSNGKRINDDDYSTFNKRVMTEDVVSPSYDYSNSFNSDIVSPSFIQRNQFHLNEESATTTLYDYSSFSSNLINQEKLYSSFVEPISPPYTYTTTPFKHQHIDNHVHSHEDGSCSTSLFKPVEFGDSEERCQWESCSLVFNSGAELVVHVSEDHIGVRLQSNSRLEKTRTPAIGSPALAYAGRFQNATRF